jgi:predicted DNA-binding transcriptional regulator AlpA
MAKHKRAKPQPVARRALTIADFCEAYQISPEYYFKMRKQGKGPREMKLGSRKLITFRAAEQWETEREKAAANAAAS